MSDALELYFFNVGHGDSTAIKFPNDEWGIIDCNRTTETISPQVLKFLIKQKVDKISFICISHPHYDHIRGIDKFEEIFHNKIKKLYLYGVGTGSPCETRRDQALIKMLMSLTDNARNPDKVDVLSKGDEKFIGDVKLKVLSPTESIRAGLQLKVYANKYSDYNKESVVMFLEYSGKQILFTGDITSEVMNEILQENTNIKADIIKISHHGSLHNNNISMLNKFIKKNAVAIISADGGIKYPSIPSLEVITFLKNNLFCNVLLTSELGFINENDKEEMYTNDGIDAISEIIPEKISVGFYKISIFSDGNINVETIKNEK